MADAWDQTWQRLPLEGVVNARELGGYPTRSGAQTRWRRFLRSDSLVWATSADVEFLRNYGVRAVIDLRGAEEVGRQPDVSLGDDVAYTNISIYEINIADYEAALRKFPDGKFHATSVYDAMFENAAAVRECMEFIASAPEGCVLFHCMVGKDRTGVLAAILLLLAGCDREDVLSSYVPSRVNLLRSDYFRSVWARDCDDIEREHYDSRPETLEHWLGRLESEYGSVIAYLEACGVSYETMAAVRERLLG